MFNGWPTIKDVPAQKVRSGMFKRQKIFLISRYASTVTSGAHSTQDPFLQRGNSIARHGIGTTRLDRSTATDYARNVRDYWHATTNKRLS